MSTDLRKAALEFKMAPLSPLVGDIDWITGFRWTVHELLSAGRAIIKHNSMPSHQWMLIVGQWKPLLEILAAHVMKAVEDGRTAPPARSYVLDRGIEDCYQLACAALDELADPGAPNEEMIAVLSDIEQRLAQWQSHSGQPEANAEPDRAENGAESGVKAVDPLGHSCLVWWGKAPAFVSWFEEWANLLPRERNDRMDEFIEQSSNCREFRHTTERLGGQILKRFSNLNPQPIVDFDHILNDCFERPPEHLADVYPLLTAKDKAERVVKTVLNAVCPDGDSSASIVAPARTLGEIEPIAMQAHSKADTPPGIRGIAIESTPQASLPRRSSDEHDQAPDSALVVPVDLGGPDDRVLVCGNDKGVLTPERYRVISALIAASRKGDRLSIDNLRKQTADGSGNVVEDPLGVLKRLRRDPDWEKVIDMAGTRGRGYRLRATHPLSPRKDQ
jgi:hypothetical protein